MACYHPLVGIDYGSLNENGKKIYKIKGNVDPREIKVLYPDSVVIPCRKCLGCKLDYSRSWADRMLLEWQYNRKACFITLTYNNDHLPVVTDTDGYPVAGTLCKRDIQLFFKSLRKYLGERKVRYFLAGEYGPKTLRPHYHAILFGVDKDDFGNLDQKGVNELGQRYYISKDLEKIWKRGFCLIADVSWKTFAYVARYVTKKVSKDLSLLSPEIQPEFVTMSRRPGLAGEYYERNRDKIFEFANIPIGNDQEGVKLNIPHFYLMKLKVENPEKYDKIMSERKMFAEDKILQELSRTSLSYLDYLETKEKEKARHVSKLKRIRV